MRSTKNAIGSSTEQENNSPSNLIFPSSTAVEHQYLVLRIASNLQLVYFVSICFNGQNDLRRL